MQRQTELSTLAAIFTKLGLIGFGGPAAHIALMEDEIVRRRAWLSRQEFLDLLGATNLIPGPNSTEMAIHIGRVRAGLPGLLVSGCCFILPSALLTFAAAWVYSLYGTLPKAQAFLYGVKPIILAVVAQALWGFFGTACKDRRLTAVAAGVAAAAAAGAHELLLLLLAGIAASSTRALPAALAVSMPGAAWAAATAAHAAVPFSLGKMFLFFLKVGSVLFGSGYVLLAFLQADLVDRWGWVTEAQLLDAVAIGQVTPGPVSATATFLGQILGGPAGAALATIGIFLPAFVFVALSGPLVPRIRESPAAGAFLDGVNAGSLALMAVVTVQLGRASVVDPVTAALALAAGVLLVRYRVNSAWLVLAGGAIGLV